MRFPQRRALTIDVECPYPFATHRIVADGGLFAGAWMTAEIAADDIDAAYRSVSTDSIDGHLSLCRARIYDRWRSTSTASSGTVRRASKTSRRTTKSIYSKSTSSTSFPSWAFLWPRRQRQSELACCRRRVPAIPLAAPWPAFSHLFLLSAPFRTQPSPEDFNIHPTAARVSIAPVEAKKHGLLFKSFSLAARLRPGASSSIHDYSPPAANDPPYLSRLADGSLFEYEVCIPTFAQGRHRGGHCNSDFKLKQDPNKCHLTHLSKSRSAAPARTVALPSRRTST